MFSGVYGKIGHILNVIGHRVLKKTHESGIIAARDGGIVADHGAICSQFPIGFVNHHDNLLTFSDI
jgi:hypothetical protein